jgi:transcriptional regulator with XRE-family HTH domain
MRGIDGAGERLRQSRLRSGKTPEEIARAAGIGAATYYDLEAHPGDIAAALSLAHLHKLAATVQADIYWLVHGEENAAVERVSTIQLMHRITELAGRSKMTTEEIEEKIGYEIGAALARPSAVLEWNLDCLKSVCGFLNLELGAVLNPESLRPPS